MMLQQPTPDDYVLATGRTVTVRDMTKAAFDHVGLNWEDHVRVSNRLFRPAEVDFLLGDPSKAREKLGWAPTIGLEEMIGEMVDADLERRRQAGDARARVPA